MTQHRERLLHIADYLINHNRSIPLDLAARLIACGVDVQGLEHGAEIEENQND